MELVTIEQMRKADKKAIGEYGIPSWQLMERAGNALAGRVMELLKSVRNAKIAVFCGPGNNGGDGWACSSALRENGMDVTVFTADPPGREKSDPYRFYKKTEKQGTGISIGGVLKDMTCFDMFVDAVFGIGLTRKPEGIYADYIKTMNSCGIPVISADIPSGLSSDEGLPPGDAVKAVETISFGKAKLCLFGEPGFEYAGKVTVDPIGIPEEAYDRSDLECFTADADFARRHLPVRRKISSKGDYGRILVIAGSPGMTGAAALCAYSSYRSGGGLVYMTAPKSRIFEYDALVTEAVCIPVEDNGRPYISPASTEDIAAAARDADVVIMGPGLEEASKPSVIFEEVAKAAGKAMIADAGLLRSLAEDTSVLHEAGKAGRIIITPHPGEMALLAGRSVEDVQKNRVATATEFARKHGVTVLLKGHRTVATDGKRLIVNMTGNPGMATAGSGDVLCGCISACAVSNKDPLAAAALGMWIHGEAGDMAAREKGEYGIMAKDIADKLPLAIKRITGV